MLREDAGEIDAAEGGTAPEADRRRHRRLPRAHVALGRRALDARGDGGGGQGARAAACSRSPITPRGRARASAARRCSSSAAALRALQGALGDSLKLLHGVELNIGRDGELDYDPEFRQRFDWCLASVHDHFELDRAAQTRRIVTAMREPSVRMIGHLSARMIGARPPIELDLDEVFARGRGDAHRARDQRRPAAPRPVRRRAASRAAGATSPSCSRATPTTPASSTGCASRR